MERPRVKAVVLAGGRGRRLGYLTRAVPKPMLKVAKRPFLEHVIVHLRGQGFREIVLLCGYRHRILRDYFGDGGRWRIHIQYSVENRPMGTGGAVRLAAPLLGSKRSFLLLNGDTYCKSDLAGMIRAHREKRARVTMGVTKHSGRKGEVRRSGSVTLDARNRVVAFEEKAAGTETVYLNSGIYVVNPGVLRLIPAGRPYSLEQQLFHKLIGKRLFGWPMKGDFVDIGTVSGYRKAARRLS